MNNVESFLQPFNIISSDLTRPWGGFYVIDETQAQLFSDTFFEGLDVSTLTIGGKFSPQNFVGFAGEAPFVAVP